MKIEELREEGREKSLDTIIYCDNERELLACESVDRSSIENSEFQNGVKVTVFVLDPQLEEFFNKDEIKEILEYSPDKYEYENLLYDYEEFWEESIDCSDDELMLLTTYQEWKRLQTTPHKDWFSIKEFPVKTTWWLLFSPSIIFAVLIRLVF